MAQIDLSGKTALVTGAGNGIGAACATAIAEAGGFVWVNDIDPQKASEVASRIGGRPLPGDVANPGEWLDPAIERGILHVLVHNAGYDLTTPVGSTDRADFDRLLAVQLSGPFEITQRLLPALKNADGALVTHIASIQARITTAEASAYAAAKGGQVAMVNSMAQDLGPYKIRALTISPGYIDTVLFDDWAALSPDPLAVRRRVEEFHPLGRMGKPEDVGSLVAFLASPLAEFINATDIVIDGGISALLIT